MLVLWLLWVVAGAASEELRATAVILESGVWSGKGGKLLGTIEFAQAEGSGQKVRVTGQLSNLGTASQLHGFHIHALGHLEGGCSSAASHFNPYDKLHGGPDDSERHVGDLGNIRSDAAGNANLDISDALIQLSGPDSILGRAVVVHALQDDLGRATGTAAKESKKTGNAGPRLGCGVVGIRSGPFRPNLAAAPNSSAPLILFLLTLALVSLFYHRRR